LWVRLLRDLQTRQYKIPQGTERPRDFNVFQEFKGGKDYFALIYADANGMGSKIEECETLAQYSEFAKKIDEVIYEAVCFAIIKHLKIADHEKQTEKFQNKHRFPFDILLLGGDDIVMVVPATVALDVASTLAKKFYEEANIDKDEQEEKHLECPLVTGQGS
jgi:CRISPR/Cas system-associated protein Cas10 (large subunit of type III CRISPR-Cas system)